METNLMSNDEEMIYKQYEDSFYMLIDRGFSRRKARRKLKKYYPDLKYNFKDGSYIFGDSAFKEENN
ncbi:hypothetical protein [Lactobacillus acetotolerans]|uniref:hypothetical protein n=1 Tax=Lactobacillus acetotolerans TaxID=1600 RepID=UPI002FD88D53